MFLYVTDALACLKHLGFGRTCLLLDAPACSQAVLLVLKQCASSRSVCHIEAETHSENITLVNVLRARSAEA